MINISQTLVVDLQEAIQEAQNAIDGERGQDPTEFPTSK